LDKEQMSKPNAVIFDIDGTLANIEHRRHFVSGPQKNFDHFYEAMSDDTLHYEIWNLCKMYTEHMKWDILICTGRPEQYRPETEKWLKRHDIHYAELLMRPDNRRYDRDYMVKQDMLNDLKTRYKIRLAFDDRDQVVKMWRQNHLICMQVADGDF